MKRFIITTCLICLIFILDSQAADLLQYQIHGLQGAALTNVQARLRNELPIAQNLNDKQMRAWSLQATKEIRAALTPFGYFKPNIHTSFIKKETNKIIIFDVAPGPQLTISQVHIDLLGEGKADPVLNKFLDEFPLEIGQPLETVTYDQAKQQLFNIALAQGYLDAQLTKHVIEIDRKHYTAKILLQLNTGKRYYFGPVTFKQDDFDDNFLRGYMRFKTGEPYSTNRLLASQDALNNSNYFQQVETNTLANPNTQQVPIEFTLKPKPAQQYTLGAGYGTDTGLRGLLGWEWRRVTRTGQRMAAVIQASQIQNTVQAVYRIPGSDPRISEYQISVSATKNNLPTVDSFTKQLGLAYVLNKKHWQQTLFLNYEIENFQFDYSPIKHFVHTLTPGITWTHVRADNMIYAHEGYRISFRVQGASQYLGSDSGFLQGEAQAKYIKSFGDDNEHRIILRTDLGYSSVEDLPNFPATLRFYAGGTPSVRGYKYQSLGPGENLIVGSVEYQHRIYGNWHAGLFYDFGNAFNNSPTRLKRGAGVGILWVSPLGPMELTLGVALDEPGKPTMIQFNMGPDFS